MNKWNARKERKGFHSLQTGKCIQRRHPMTYKGLREVSIPFKRESVSKVDDILQVIRKYKSEFPFPSNGKVYPKFFMDSL